MKKTFFVIAGVLSVIFFVLPGHAATSAFSDTKGNQYQESIQALHSEGVLQGYANGEFRPSQPINRAELLKVIFTARKEEGNAEAKNCFPDVQGQWFARFVCTATEQGFVRGYPDHRFRPEQAVNMAEALKIALKMMEVSVREAQEGEEWYEAYVEFAHTNNLFSKFAYLPGRPARRDEVAFLVHQLMLIKKGTRVIASERDLRSAGCGVRPLSAAPTNFTVKGVQRESITVIPQGYDMNKPIALVFSFHGRTNSNSMVQGYYGIERASDGQAIVVYPAGIKRGSSFTWSDGGDSAGNLRDYEFFDVMLEQFMSSYCVNIDEVYVIAHSLGAWFSNSLACARGDVIRAVGTLGGGRSNSACSGPVAVMILHNPKDELVPFAQGVTARDQYREQNQCGTSTVPVAEPAWGNCVQYQRCSEDAPLIWCPHTQDHQSGSGQYYTHNWPRETGREIWDFWRNLED